MNGHVINTFQKELSESIKANQTVVFCGAGVSRNSGIPVVNELVSLLLTKLDVTSDHAQIVSDSGIPFESFIQTLRATFDLNTLFKIFELGEPNINHYLLAHLSKSGYLKTICTTNFDCQIETAFSNVGLIRDKDYVVYFRESEFEKIDWNGIVDSTDQMQQRNTLRLK